jgi:chromate transporter
MVVQFVGFLAASQAGLDLPMLAGVSGALLVVWVTFVPCFLWIFLGAPYVERLRGNAALAGALAAITAAVVGVIASLALWFAIHVLFAEQGARGWPVMESLRWQPTLLVGIALLLLFAMRRGVGLTLAVCATLGAAITPFI